MQMGIATCCLTRIWYTVVGMACYVIGLMACQNVIQKEFGVFMRPYNYILQRSDRLFTLACRPTTEKKGVGGHGGHLIFC